MSKYSMQSLSPIVEVDALSAPFGIGKVRVEADLLEWFGGRIAAALTASGLPFDPSRLSETSSILRAFHDEFVTLTPEDDFKIPGSTSAQGMMPLWLAARLIAPDVLVESGVFVGSSLRMFRHALPEARIFAYDITFGPLKYRDESIDYRECDWIENLPQIDSQRPTLAFFDDHVDAARRLDEAISCGVDWVLFDDNPHVGHLGWYRYPSLPSVPMIVDESFPDGAVMEWPHPSDGPALRYTHDAERCAALRDRIEASIDFGALMRGFGVNSGDKWLIKLK